MPRWSDRLKLLPAVVLAIALQAPGAHAGWYEYMVSQPSPRFAVLIDPMLVLAGLYSGVIQVKPQVQWSPWRHLAFELSPVFLYAYAKDKKVDTDVIGGGGTAGMRFVLNHLRGLYLSTRAGPLGLKSEYIKRVIMLLEIELGWSWAPRRRGLIMSGGMGYQGYFPLDRESRLHYVAAHTFMINYAIGYCW